MIPTLPTPPTPPTDYDAPTPTGSVVSTYAELAAEMALAGPRVIVVANGRYTGSAITTTQGHQIWAQNRGGAVFEFGIGFRGNAGNSGGEVHGVIFDIDDTANTDTTALLNEACVNTWDAVAPYTVGSDLVIEDCEFYGNRVIGSGIQAASPSGLTVRRCRFRNFIDVAISAFRNGSGPDDFDLIVLEDLDIADIARPTPGSASGVSAEIGLNLGHRFEARRVKIRDCAWAGVGLVNEVNGWILEDFDIDRVGWGYFEAGSVGIYCEHSHDGDIRRCLLGPEMKVGINAEWNSDNADPWLNSLVPRNYDIRIEDVWSFAYKVGIHFDLSVSGCTVRRCRLERSWMAGVLDNNTFPDDTGAFPVPSGREPIVSTNVVDFATCEFVLHPDVPTLLHDQHGGAALAPTVEGWPLDPLEVDENDLQFSWTPVPNVEILLGPPKAWGARENGDPTDPESPLVPILVGEWNAVQTATDRIFKQWERTVTWPATMQAIGELFADVEEVLSDVRLRRHRSTAEGVQLEEVGALVNRPRGSLSSDADYRLAILSDAWSQIASGTGPQVIEIVSALTDGAGLVREFFPAVFQIRVPNLDAVRFDLLSDIMRDVPGAGIGAILSTYDEDLAGGFSSVYAALPGESDDVVFRPRALDHVDPVSEVTGSPDGTTYDPDFDARSYSGTTPGDRIDWTPGAADFADVPFTVAGWVYLDTLANESRVWSTQYSSLNSSHFLSVDTSGRLRFFGASDGGTDLDVLSTDTVSVGSWHHVAATADGTNTAAGVRLYIDGEEVLAYTTTIDGVGSQRATDFTWSLGGRERTDSNNVDGRIADFRAWSRELEAYEIQHSYRQASEGGFNGPPEDSESSPVAFFSSYHGASSVVRGLFSSCRTIGE